MSKKRTAKAIPPAPKSTAGGPMNVELLEQITRLMRENDLNTVDVRDGGKRIVLKRGAVIEAAPVAHSAPVTPVAVRSDASASDKTTSDDDAKLVPIKSPMVGTFYASPSHEAKAFITVGSRVDDDTDVCIIEAMKVFNNIKAETRGTVAKILVQNAETVEFGQVLFLVKP